ncbi:MAG TPA: cysteine--tRNA ligase, partial [Paracoccus sp.]|nr:cysteine--tRNA ligase [Paracoccus sp. (in: a-proteobacteria)]
MVEIQLTNTRSRSKERLVPIDPQNLRMYLCGPTVYDRAHLGNARPVVVFDVLYRLLRHVYGPDHVTYARNFTDVDDKINAAALARREAGDPRPLEELIRERTEETIGWYHADMDALGALRPDHEPRATDYIPQMIAMIEDLVAKGHAYAAEGHVLFDVRSFPGYGRLSGRSVDDMIAGARVEIAPFKRDPMDFVLWKPSDSGLPGWDSPWGRGRPGWHIECSAMSEALLGRSFDIHGGGIDLQFPHHENEIAQSCCAHPHDEFARIWLHNEMLQVEGKKMSKSLGNFFTVRDLLDQGIPGEVIRFVFLMTHYRKPMDWTADKAREAEATLRNWHIFSENVQPADEPDSMVVDALADDLNTSAALARLHALLKEAMDAGSGTFLELRRKFLASARLMGLLLPGSEEWTKPSKVQAEIRETLSALGIALQQHRRAK